MQRKTGLGIRKEKREGEEIAEDKRGPKAKRRRRYEEREEEERTTDASAALESCDEMQELASFSPTENDTTSRISSHDSQSCASRKSCRLTALADILPPAPACLPSTRAGRFTGPALFLTPHQLTRTLSYPSHAAAPHPAVLLTDSLYAVAPRIAHPRRRTPHRTPTPSHAHAIIAVRSRTRRNTAEDVAGASSSTYRCAATTSVAPALRPGIHGDDDGTVTHNQGDGRVCCHIADSTRSQTHRAPSRIPHSPPHPRACYPVQRPPSPLPPRCHPRRERRPPHPLSRPPPLPSSAAVRNHRAQQPRPRLCTAPACARGGLQCPPPHPLDDSDDSNDRAGPTIHITYAP